MTTIGINRSKYIHMNAFFFGLTENPSSSNFQRLECLRQLGVNVQAHNTGIYSASLGLFNRVRRKLTRVWFSADEIRRYNEGVLNACVGAAPDFVWFEWPLQMNRETLIKIRERWPQSLIICHQDDNPFGDQKADRPRWRRFIEAIPLYDVHFVKRVSDLVEFKKRGAKHVLLITHGVFEPLFHPDDRPLEKRGPKIPVSFVGTALDHRIGYISSLISRHQVPLRVHGELWGRTWVGWRYRDHFFNALNDKEYTVQIWDSKISLGFVCSSNRDEYSGRSFQIPGSGGFFLAERTPKHQALYEEGKEAEFFASVEECADKIKFYLNNEEARQKIAAAGYERCIRSDYSMVSVVRGALHQLFP